jgi:hypothetical protein
MRPCYFLGRIIVNNIVDINREIFLSLCSMHRSSAEPAGVRETRVKSVLART